MLSLQRSYKKLCRDRREGLITTYRLRSAWSLFRTKWKPLETEKLQAGSEYAVRAWALHRVVLIDSCLPINSAGPIFQSMLIVVFMLNRQRSSTSTTPPAHFGPLVPGPTKSSIAPLHGYLVPVVARKTPSPAPRAHLRLVVRNFRSTTRLPDERAWCKVPEMTFNLLPEGLSEALESNLKTPAPSFSKAALISSACAWAGSSSLLLTL